MHLFRADDLVVFMAFARDQQDVSGPSQAHGRTNGITTIGNHVVLQRRFELQRFANSDLHIQKDRQRIFCSGVIRCQNHNIAEFHGGAAHFRTFPAVSITTTSK